MSRINITVTQLSPASWDVQYQEFAQRPVHMRVRNLRAGIAFSIEVQDPLPSWWSIGDDRWQLAFTQTGTGTSLADATGRDLGLNVRARTVRAVVLAVVEAAGLPRPQIGFQSAADVTRRIGRTAVARSHTMAAHSAEYCCRQ